MDKDYTQHIYKVLLFFGIVLFFVLLKVTVAFSLPVTIATLITFVAYPVVKKMNTKLKMPWVLCSVLIEALIVLIIITLFTILGKSFASILSQYAKYEAQFDSIFNTFAEKLHLQFDQETTFFQKMWSSFKIRDGLQKAALVFSGNVISFVKNMAMILLFSIFLLIEMKYGHKKIEEIFQGQMQSQVILIIKKTISETINYLSIKFFISLATSILVYAVIKPIRMDFAVVWAFFAFTMNFIPTFGSIFSVGFTTLFALLQFYPSIWQPIYVLIMTTSINLILGNIVEPRIEGKNLGLSPFVILVGLTFSNFIWGFVGMIIAVPMMVTAKILCENVNFLKPLAALMGNYKGDSK